MSARRNKKNLLQAIATASLGVAIFIFSFSGAAPYSIYGTTSRATATSSLLTPFLNFFDSIGSIGVSDTSPNTGSKGGTMNQPSLPQSISLVTDTENAFRQFDDWTYRTTGLRISALYVGLLQGFSWFFGVIKAGVDWLLQRVH
jgi:hypothetical protein